MTYPVARALIMATSIVVVTSGCSDSKPVQPPADQVRTFFDALKNSDQRACDSLVDSQRAKCQRDWGLTRLHTKDYVIHNTVINGDRALVSVTGTSCSVAGCETVSDAAAGMPSASVSFDEAWAGGTATTTSGSAAKAAVRLIKTDGSWRIQA